LFYTNFEIFFLKAKAFVHFFFFCAHAPQSKEEKTEPKKKKILGLVKLFCFFTTLQNLTPE